MKFKIDKMAEILMCKLVLGIVLFGMRKDFWGVTSEEWEVGRGGLWKVV